MYWWSITLENELILKLMKKSFTLSLKTPNHLSAHVVNNNLRPHSDLDVTVEVTARMESW